MFGIDDAVGLALGAGLGFLRDENSQDFAREQQANQQAYNASEALRNRQWQQEMSDTAIQRRVKDLQAAGINPLLAWTGGGATTPSGGQASASIASPTPQPNMIAGFNSALQAASISKANEQRDAEIEKARAEAERIRAEKTEIEARTPTHAANINQINQNIAESQERIRKIIQDTETSANTATNIAQQTENLKAMLPQIAEQIKQLRAHTVLNYAQAKQAGAATNLTEEQYKEVQQRIRANLPAAEAALTNARTALEVERLPQLQSRANVYGAENKGHMLGTAIELLRAINPLNVFKGD